MMDHDDQQVLDAGLQVTSFTCKVDGYPTGDYQSSADGEPTPAGPGRLSVPCPAGLQCDPEGYARLWVDRQWDSAYITCSKRDSIERFLHGLAGLRHLALEQSGWSLGFLRSCPDLRILELRSNIALDSPSKLEPIKSCRHLECLVVQNCNNIFSGGITGLARLRSLVIRDVPKLVNIEALIDCLGAGACPLLDELKINNVQYGGPVLDLSPLRKIHTLKVLQYVGTRVSSVDQRFIHQMEERQDLADYIERIDPGTTTVRLDNPSVHGDDIELLSERAPSIQMLELSGCHDLLGLDEVTRLAELNCLKIVDCPKVGSVACLEEVGRLGHLEVVGGRLDLEFGGVLQNRSLRHLHVSLVGGSLVEWDGMTLRLVGVPAPLAVQLLESLESVDSASNLVMEDCVGPLDIASLRRCKSLRGIRIAHCPGIQDYLPLGTLVRLDGLAIVGGSGESMSLREYEHAMAGLQLELPSSCDFACDVPDEVLHRIHEEVDDFFRALEIELGGA